MSEKQMTEAERVLVEDHLELVHWVIQDHIQVQKHIVGMEYYDLVQHGCLLLIKAARAYNAERGDFVPFARKVILNGLRSHCKYTALRHGKRRHLIPSGEPTDDNDPSNMDAFNGGDDTTRAVEANDIIEVLSSFLPEYSGVARKGIEALILKIRGFNGADIAEIYGVDQYNVGAWISRAKQKLRVNSRFAGYMKEIV